MEKSHLCLSCGNVFPANLEMCPRRYMSDHTDSHVREVITELLRLGWNGEETPHKKLVDLALSRVTSG